MTNADEYIQKFKELEAIVKETFGLNDWDSVTNFLSKRDEYRPFREEIRYCQEVRNLLQHKQKIGGEYPAILLDDVFSELDDSRRNYILGSLDGRQIIVTSCEPDIIPSNKSGNITFRHVKDGEILEE